MKKLLSLVIMAIIIMGCDGVDPLRYKGCLIVQKWDFPSFYFKVKLTPEMRDSLHVDYKKFYVEKYEFDMYEIGDTIR